MSDSKSIQITYIQEKNRLFEKQYAIPVSDKWTEIETVKNHLEHVKSDINTFLTRMIDESSSSFEPKKLKMNSESGSSEESDDEI